MQSLLLYLQTFMNMRQIISIFFILAMPFIVKSQTYEVGGYLGGANYIGDVGKTNYIAPNTSVLGFLGKWNRSSRHSFRASVSFAKLAADDNESDDARRKERGYSFENNIVEISGGLEFTFWEFSMYSGKPAHTPYLYTGITFFWYDSLYKPSVGNITDYDGGSSFAIPMVIGYKASIGTNFVIAGEFGARYTFTDNIDGSNPTGNLEDNESLKFGNVNNNDWYVFTGITLTYTFGRKPCYCNF
jgi:hypothetical protein